MATNNYKGQIKQAVVVATNASHVKPLNYTFQSGVAIYTLLLHRRGAFVHRAATCQPFFKP